MMTALAAAASTLSCERGARRLIDKAADGQSCSAGTEWLPLAKIPKASGAPATKQWQSSLHALQGAIEDAWVAKGSAGSSCAPDLVTHWQQCTKKY